MVDVDARSRELYDLLESSNISRRAYRDAFDDLYCVVPAQFRRVLDRRKDRRSLGEFALEIYDTTLREKKLINEWNERNEYGLKIEKFGSDDSGVVIFDPRNISSKADYVVAIGDQRYKLEIKFCPTLAKLTYKVKDLNSYVAEAAYVLTFMYDRKMLGPNDTIDTGRMQWFLMEPGLMQRLLDTLPTKLYWEMGGKPAIQILQKDFDKYIKVNPW